MSEVSVAMLTYRDLRWARWALEGLNAAKNDTSWRPWLVGCDPEPQVRNSGALHVIHESKNPAEFYINRVYRAWNAAVQSARTQWVALINSDMYVSDWWLDELVACKSGRPKSLPTSLLVESGRIPSAMPEYAQNLGESRTEQAIVAD